MISSVRLDGWTEPCCEEAAGPFRGAVIICPGGGYEWLSPREGAPVARVFQRAGYRAFVLNYSTGEGPLGTQPLRELARAVETVRGRAEAEGFPGNRVAVCGFSAGGHLAASLGVHWPDALIFGGRDAVRRPDALILAYPVITAGVHAHRESMRRLAGEGSAAFFSLEKHVSADTPPTFLWHTAADATVPVENSLLFFEALREAGVEAELHVWPNGAHGLSLATEEVAEPEKGRRPDARVAEWFSLCLGWMENVFA